MPQKDKSAKFYLLCFFSFTLSLLISALILHILDFKPGNPGNLDDIIPFWRESVFPQMYKYYKYGLASLIIFVGTLLSYFFLPKLISGKRRLSHPVFPLLPTISAIILLFTFILFVVKSVKDLDIYNYIFELDPIVYSGYHLAFFASGVLILILFYVNISRFPKFILRNKIRKLRVLIPLIAIFLIVITLFDRTFNEKYLFIGRIVQYIHTIPIMAPIHDVLNQKVIFVDADSQYGLLIAYLPALLFKFFIPFSFTSFFYLMIVLGIFYYLSLYFLLRLRLKSDLWALTGLFSFFTYHFYAAFDRYTRPMVFPMRYLFDLTFFILLWKSDVGKKRWTLIILPCYLATAFFYSFEVGFSLIVAYFSYLFLRIITDIKIRNIWAKVSAFALDVFAACSWIFLLGAFYSFYTLFSKAQLPDWQHVFLYINVFSRGFGAGEDLPFIGFHLFPVFIYFIVLIRSFIKIINGEHNHRIYWDTSLATYGLIIFLYFLKSPYILNLVIVSIPAIILTITLFQELVDLLIDISQKPQSSFAKSTFFAPYIVLGSFFVLGLSLYVFRLGINQNHVYWGSKDEQRESSNIYDELTLSSTALTKYDGNSKKVVIFSTYDGFMNIKANKVNALRLTNSQLILTLPQVESLLSELKKTNPTYIYADNDNLNTNFTQGFTHFALLPQIFDYIANNYQKVETIGILDVWRKRGV